MAEPLSPASSLCLSSLYDDSQRISADAVHARAAVPTVRSCEALVGAPARRLGIAKVGSAGRRLAKPPIAWDTAATAALRASDEKGG